MKITNVKVTTLPKKKNSNLLAFASVELDKCFVVSGIKVLDGEHGLFIGMPSKANKDGEYFDICFPVTKDFREALTEEVITAYKEA